MVWVTLSQTRMSALQESYWLGKEGQRLLQTATAAAQSVGYDPTKSALKIRNASPQHPHDLLRRATEIVLCRRRIQHLGPWAAELLLTKQGLEQSTIPLISQHHAARFLGCAKLLEICTGLGFDSAALARSVKTLCSIEADPAVAQMAAINLHIRGIDNVSILCGRAEQILHHAALSKFDGFFADPSRRRADGTRISAAKDYHPPLNWLLGLPVAGIKAIKISPGLNLEYLPPNWAREWIGFEDECREQLLWSHEAQVDDGTVTIFSGRGTGTKHSWVPSVQKAALTGDEESVRQPEAGDYLVEPHASMIRSGRLADFFSQNNFGFMHPKIALGLCQEPKKCAPFGRFFQILEVLPADTKLAGKRLRELGWSRAAEIKKRGVEVDPDQMRRTLKLGPVCDNDDSGVVLFTRTLERHIILLCKRVQHD